MNPQTERIILGIDPGTTVMGYGVIKVQKDQLTMLTCGVIQLHKYTDYVVKLKRIFDRTLSLIEEFHPDEMAIEAQFFGKNVQSMLKLGRAQGVSIAAALSRDLSVEEYQPRKVKQSVCGNGNASKEQVAAMIQTLLKLKEIPKELDATDGLAIAICHYFQTRMAGTATQGKSWKAFINSNPGRVRKS